MNARHLALVIVVVGLLEPAATRADLVLPGSEAAEPAFTLPPQPSKWELGANTASLFSADAPPGTPGEATWSIMGPGLGLSDAASGFDPFHGTNVTSDITVLGFTVSEIETMIDTALDVWAAVSGFTNLGQVTDGGVDAGASEASGGHLGDIRIAAWEFAFPFNLLSPAHAITPGTEATDGDGGTFGGDLHLSIDQIWVDDPTDTNADADIDLLTVLIHELGHSLGLDHSTTPGSVMEANYMGARRTLHADDIAGIQAIYGPAAAAVPEPPMAMLFGLALLGMAFAHASRRR